VDLALTDDQKTLAELAADVMAREAPLSAFRALRDAGGDYDAALWAQLSALGWPALILPEEYEGMGMGWADLAVVMEAMGRNLVRTPLLASVCLSGQVIAIGGDAPMKSAWLPRLAAGEARLACAWRERGSGRDAERVETRADPAPGGYVLSGLKAPVLDAPVADAFIVSAWTHEPRERGHLSLFLVPADAPGVTVTRQRRIDAVSAGRVALEAVAVPTSARIGGEDAGTAILEAALDRACVALCAELLGGAQAVLDVTLDYLKTRHQFGAPIGSFQALQHRAVRLFICLELARSAVMAAARVADADPAALPASVSLAKARVSEAFLHVAREAVQMHGGIGMTDECDVGFYLKRARCASLTFGGAAWHRARWARLGGY